MLSTYLSRTEQLLQNPVPAAPIVTPAILTDYINQARLQIAGEAEAIRVYGSLAVTNATQQYAFSAISLAGTSGVSGVFNVKQVSVRLGTGAQYVRARPFAWFNQYHLMDPVPAASLPKVYAQYGQGETGSLFINLLDGPYTLNLDCVCVPATLATDSDPEALPYPWTDCVPLFAAFWAFLTAQRTADADQMYKRYEQFAQRARAMSTPTVLAGIYPQVPDPRQGNQLGLDRMRFNQGA